MTAAQDNFRLWRFLQGAPGKVGLRETKWHRSRRKPLPSLTTLNSRLDVDVDVSNYFKDKKEEKFDLNLWRTSDNNCDKQTNDGQDDSTVKFRFRGQGDEKEFVTVKKKMMNMKKKKPLISRNFSETNETMSSMKDIENFNNRQLNLNTNIRIKRNYLFNLNSLLSSLIVILIVFQDIILFQLEARKLVINVINTNGLEQHYETLRRHKRSALVNSSNILRQTQANDVRDLKLNATNSWQVNSPVNEPLETGASSNLASSKVAKLMVANSGDQVDALGYLERYGYMNKTSSPNANLISEDSFESAIMSFQRFAGIPETGTVDSMTVKYMQMPRCGNKDQSGKGEENGKRKRRRRKRYALQGSKWRRQELTYRISQYPTRFAYKKFEVDGQIEKAFKIWSQVAPIDFVVKKEGRVHIDIRFASGEHGDGDPFDGPGNTLAHAYFPQYGGDAHFDDQEYWTVDSYAGTNIFQVAAHELGHSLGLGHSSVREALMAPFYQKYKPNFKLHADDILAIQALYGERDGGDLSTSKPQSTSTTTTTTTVSSRDNSDSDSNDDDDDKGGGGFFNFGGSSGSKAVDLCQDAKIDAITRTEDGNTYVFRGQHYWQIKNEGLANGGVAGKISRDWDNLPGNLDAALTWSDGKTFFFKGDKYWRFFNKRREPGYPKLISAGFAGIPNNVDASFVWSGNGKTYFFKKDKYWRFDSKQEPPVSSQYPKSIKNWSGLPSNGIDGAFKWDNGMTYFFKDDLYYRFDDREFEVDTSARPTFPRSTAEWWFGCTNSNLPLIASSKPTRKSNLDVGDNLDSNEDLSTSSKSMLFHRRPNLVYSINQDSPSDHSSSFANTNLNTLDKAQATKPAGNSMSRSILNSLSNLFASSDSDSTPNKPESSQNQQVDDDWSFHRGIVEEVRKTMNKARAAFSNVLDNSINQSPKATILNNNNSNNPNKAKRALTGSESLPDKDNSRWLFPLLSPPSSTSHRNSFNIREQSLSELKMDPNEDIEAQNNDQQSRK